MNIQGSSSVIAIWMRASRRRSWSSSRRHSTWSRVIFAVLRCILTGSERESVRRIASGPSWGAPRRFLGSWRQIPKARVMCCLNSARLGDEAAWPFLYWRVVLHQRTCRHRSATCTPFRLATRRSVTSSSMILPTWRRCGVKKSGRRRLRSVLPSWPPLRDLWQRPCARPAGLHDLRS